ncbi:DUF1998 domain-containing protein [Microbispora sp. CSR-4]|uniref:DUF1998 domain-containing protein n=1 Tax=Microbispora sp. CSR-4 TaxID=2592813 RepID=UPI0011CC6003|nr:DUF1998 domain-containing protein [Microbispora sp. CSR-4]
MPKYQAIRPSQFITTFGPGSIVETPSGPVVLKSVDELFRKNNIEPHDFEIMDDRMSQGVLEGAKICRIPTNAEIGEPEHEEIYPTDGLPYWALCTQHKSRDVLYQIGNGCPDCGTLPTWARREKGGKEAIRFVMACEGGHLDEVPWSAVVHLHSKPCGAKHFHWHGGGRALRLVRITCPTCGASENFGTAYGRSWKCSDRQPELGSRPESSTCSRDAFIVQRGSANLRIADLVTALTILDIPARLNDILGYGPLLHSIRTLRRLDRLTQEELLTEAKESNIPADEIDYLARTPWPEIEAAVDQLLAEQPVGELAFRAAELRRLRQAATSGAPVLDHEDERRGTPLFEVRRSQVRSVRGPNNRVTFRVTPVSRLRMVMVQRGFRRLDPNAPVVPTAFTRRTATWYPGVELFGEGIFLDLGDTHLTLEGSRLHSWEALHAQADDPDDLTKHPVHVWWHSLAHRLLWALSVDSGYSSAAIRERVYLNVDSGQATGGGVLLYTVQPGGDGTMGGMISLVDRFDRVLRRALGDVDTCSNDPLCEEAIGSGAEGAACFSCLLASETSCEHRNHGLDRLLLAENLP